MQPCPWCVLQRLIFLGDRRFAVLGLVWRGRPAPASPATFGLLLAACGIAAALWQLLRRGEFGVVQSDPRRPHRHRDQLERAAARRLRGARELRRCGRRRARRAVPDMVGAGLRSSALSCWFASCAGAPEFESEETVPLDAADAPADIAATVATLFRRDSRKVLATLIRLLGDFDLAEEAMHDAFMAAVEQWPRDGIPANPCAWLVSAGRFKAIDAHPPARPLRRDRRRLAERIDGDRRRGRAGTDEESVEDDRLRLIFTCCHPSLPPDAQVALTLREMCGLTTEEIARAFLTPRPDPGPAHRPGKGEDPRRPHSLSGAGAPRSCLTGSMPCCASSTWSSTKAIRPPPATSLTRPDLSAEAIRLGRLLVELLPEREAMGLLALMLLHESRSCRAHRRPRRARPARRPGSVAVGSARRSMKGAALGANAPLLVACASVPTRCRRRSRPCTPARRAPRRPTGPRSSASTTSSSGRTRRRWSRSTGPSRSRCATAPPPACR